DAGVDEGVEGVLGAGLVAGGVLEDELDGPAVDAAATVEEGLGDLGADDLLLAEQGDVRGLGDTDAEKDLVAGRLGARVGGATVRRFGRGIRPAGAEQDHAGEHRGDAGEPSRHGFLPFARTVRGSAVTLPERDGTVSHLRLHSAPCKGCRPVWEKDAKT